MNKSPRNNTSNGGMQGNMSMPRQNNGDTNMTPAALLEEIRALSFVKSELELFLDTHPNCRQALDYYRQTVDALDSYMERYHEEVGPLIASGAVNPDTWTWVDTPWPWQVANGAPKWEGGKK